MLVKLIISEKTKKTKRDEAKEKPSLASVIHNSFMVGNCGNSLSYRTINPFRNSNILRGFFHSLSIYTLPSFLEHEKGNIIFMWYSCFSHAAIFGGRKYIKLTFDILNCHCFRILFRPHISP